MSGSSRTQSTYIGRKLNNKQKTITDTTGFLEKRTNSTSAHREQLQQDDR